MAILVAVALAVVLQHAVVASADTLAVAGSARADSWLPQFPVPNEPPPTSGRRGQIVAAVPVGTSDASLRSVTVGGEECLNLPGDKSADISKLHWCRAHANPATGQLWIAFHTANTEWLSTAGAVKVTSSSGAVLVNATAALEQSEVVVSYFTTVQNGSKAIVHVHSNSGSTRLVTSLYVDGSLSATLPAGGLSLPAGGHAVFEVDLPGQHQKRTGAVWTTVVTTAGSSASDDSVTSGYGGRTIPERFPIESWPESTDCPLPPGNSTNAATIQKIGVDSVFYSFGSWNSKCKPDYATVLKSLAGTSGTGGWWHVFLDGEGDSDRRQNAALSPATRAAVVDAILIGDEVDGAIDADHLRSSLNKSLECIKSTPDLVTYQGAATAANVGAFSGIADIQGIDAYIAACAPTQLPSVKYLPMTYPYYYLRNARDNQSPMPMWGYSQLYNGDKGLSNSASRSKVEAQGQHNQLGWAYQANANELVAQIAQTVLAGSKALMLFQTVQSDMEVHDEKLIANVIMSIRSLSPAIRAGDIEGVRFSTSAKINEDVMIETILSRDPAKVIIAIININAKGYSNLLCHVDVSKHWNFSEQTVDHIKLDLTSAPQVAGTSNWQEMVNGVPVAPKNAQITTSNSSVTLSNVALDDNMVARFFVANVDFKA